MKHKIKLKDLLEINNKLDLMIRTSLDLKRNALLKKIFNTTELENLKEKFNTKELKRFKASLNAGVEKPLKKEVHRKLYHMSSLWIPLSIYFLPSYLSISIFMFIMLGDIILEYGNYKRWKWARKTFGYVFFKVLRKEERRRKKFRISGSAYVFIAAILSMTLFSHSIAIIGLTVMIISDTFAALVGRAWGTRKIIKNKSIEGTFAFFLSALIINMCFQPIFVFTYVSVIACMVATLAEIYGKKIKLDDNLSIPLAVGLVLTILG